MANEQSTLKIEIEGMTCGGCASRVTSALQRDARVESAVIDFATRTGVVVGALTRKDVQTIVESIGYKLASFTDQEEPSGAKGMQGISPEMSRMMIAGAIAIPEMILAMGTFDIPHNAIWQMVLTSVFLLWPASGFFQRTWKQLGQGYVTMDTLVSIGMASAWAASLVMMRTGSHHLYFETAVMIGFFVLLGKALEDQARRKSIGDVDKLVRLRPRKIWRIAAGGQPEEIFLAEAKVGEHIYLRPGDMLALDGEVIEGEASFDESVITGESVPVVHQRGDRVPSGAVNAGSTGVTLKITRIGGDTTIEQIIRLIEDARLSRPPIQKFADRVSAVFVPIVMLLAVGTTLVCWFFGYTDPLEAVMRGLSVLVVACPCALGLATPVAWVAGLGRAARSGVLVRSYEALETLRKADAVIFDKTGTLTYGRPKVLRVIPAKDGDANREIMAATLSALAHSSHPLSRAISQWIKEQHQVGDAPLSKLIEEKAGAGVICEIKSPQKEVIRYGRPDFVTSDSVVAWEKALSSGHPVVAVAKDSVPVLLFELEDSLRDDVNDALKKITARGVSVHIASGDKVEVVAELVKHLVHVTSFKGTMTPTSKKDLVLELRASGKTVAFVGDGINDAPALAAADVGITLGTGTDVAAHSSGLVLQKSGISTLVDAMDLSGRITRIIRENFFWAFFYNVAAIPVAMAGYVTPAWAAAAMALSSVSVVMNALRLRR